MNFRVLKFSEHPAVEPQTLRTIKNSVKWLGSVTVISPHGPILDRPHLGFENSFGHHLAVEPQTQIHREFDEMVGKSNCATPLMA